MIEKKLEDKDNITIIGRRWWNRRKGSTYHSAEVWINNKLLGKADYAYGYGEQYICTALGILQQHGYYMDGKDVNLTSGIRKDLYELNSDIVDNRSKFAITVTDVQRKRDL